MRRSRILFVINTLDRGGAERSLVNLLNQMDFTDKEVDLLILTGKASLVSELPPEVRLINKSTYGSSVRLFFRCLYALFCHGYLFMKFKYLFVNFVRMIREKRILPDKLLWEAVAYSAPVPGREYDLAIAYTEGGSAYYVADRIKAYEKRALIHIDMQEAGYCRELDEDRYEKFDRIGTASEDAKESFLTEYPSLSGKTYLFENPLDEECIRRLSDEESRIHFRKGALRIYTAERLVKQKAPDISVRAASILRYRGVKFEWIIAGDGPEKKKLQKLIKKSGLTGQVVLTGELSNPYPLMRECDVYVQATSYEGKSMSVREADILGKPAIVSDRSGNSVKASDEMVVDLSPEGIAGGIISFQKNRGL